MRAGSLDRIVQLQGAVESRTASGGVLIAWTTFATVYASRRDTLGSERLTIGVEQTSADSVWRIRWRDDVTSSTRLREGDVAWDIIAVAELGRRDGLDLTCNKITI
jgi:SPP1 family predicted phage head-tail adaptor